MRWLTPLFCWPSSSYWAWQRRLTDVFSGLISRLLRALLGDSGRAEEVDEVEGFDPNTPTFQRRLIEATREERLRRGEEL